MDFHKTIKTSSKPFVSFNGSQPLAVKNELAFVSIKQLIQNTLLSLILLPDSECG